MNQSFKHFILFLSALTVLSACAPSIGGAQVVVLSTITATTITVPTAVVTTAVTPSATLLANDEVTAVASATTSPATTCTDAATFVTDVSVPDGTQFAPSTGFNKTWRIQNSGSCTWDSNYKLIHAGGDRLGAIAAAFSLPTSVAPGQTIDLSVSLVAPAAPAAYQSDWKLQNAQGQAFGIGSNHNSPFWVKIVVTEPQASHNGRIGGFAWQDQDFDNEVETSEFLPNVSITLASGANCSTALQTVTTDGDGRFDFANLPADTYCLSGTDGKVTVGQSGLVLAANQHLSDVNVTWPPAWPEPATISGWLWHDYCYVSTNEDGSPVVDGPCVDNGNGGHLADGMIQSDENYIAGVTVKLMSGSCVGDDIPAQLIAETNSDGNYRFEGLQPGVYCVFIDAAEAHNAAILLNGTWTFPAYDVGFHEIALGTGDHATPVNFGWDVDESNP